MSKSDSRASGQLHAGVVVLAVGATLLSLPETELRRKIEGLALLQRIIVLDHEQPLFVPAFVRKTLASMGDDYYDFDHWSSINPKR